MTATPDDLPEPTVEHVEEGAALFVFIERAKRSKAASTDMLIDHWMTHKAFGIPARYRLHLLYVPEVLEWEDRTIRGRWPALSFWQLLTGRGRIAE